MERVVITGMGAVSPYGIGVEPFINGLKKGHCAVKLMEEWREIEGLRSHLAAPVDEIDFKKYIKRKFRRNMGRMAMYAAIAAQEAVDHAGLSQNMLSSGKTGVVMGSTTGSPEFYEQFFSGYLPNKVFDGIKSGTFFKIMSHTCSANVAQMLSIRGEQWSSCSACASSSQAIGLGMLLIQSGRQEVVICGGADEVHPMVTAVFDLVGAASVRNHAPQTTPRPFDKDRDGVVCGEGGGALILESLSHAQARGAHILGELLGFGHSNDCKHITSPDVEAMMMAMNSALDHAGIKAEDIDFINGHATGTEIGDKAEALAISEVFGNNVLINSFKGHIGHALGAAGVLETIAALDAFKSHTLMPTLHFKELAPDFPAINVLTEPWKGNINLFLKNSFAFGGVNTSFVVKRWSN
ncbi:MAG: beta-ketoacyl-[acyl-carrier-protein] synthase family protein [Gammaproteobacteria bacterium]|nr:beta-ketoacyl-[acyl-carrier-protein] synthase family protein [Gammaproteobacteria bacterium]